MAQNSGLPEFWIGSGASRVNPTCGVKPGHDESKTTAAVLPRQIEPAHARHLAAGGADARDRLRERLERDRPVEGGGVNERGGVAHRRDMALPEHEGAPP